MVVVQAPKKVGAEQVVGQAGPEVAVVAIVIAASAAVAVACLYAWLIVFEVQVVVWSIVEALPIASAVLLLDAVSSSI